MLESMVRIQEASEQLQRLASGTASRVAISHAGKEGGAESY